MEEHSTSNKTYAIWIITTIMLTIVAFCLFASATVYIDPLFHYHKPLQDYEYPLNDERYQNDGITRNFEYDGIITGSSMSENFKTSEADDIFNAKFIKVAFSGGRYKEVNDNLKRAYDAGKNIRYVIRNLDYSYLVLDKNEYRKDAEYPTYLYNDNILDDVQYVLNKSILLNQTRNVIKYTQAGNKTTTFDAYANWNRAFSFGAETVLSTYTLGEKEKDERILLENEVVMIQENIQQNVTDLADQHPETVFYLFFPPYSICYWDMLNNSGEINWRIDAEQIAIEKLLKHPNIKLYSFCNEFELICNLDNYKDCAHYGEWVNSWILEWMRNEKHLVTEENYEEYIEEIKEFYRSYDYSQLRK